MSPLRKILPALSLLLALTYAAGCSDVVTVDAWEFDEADDFDVENGLGEEVGGDDAGGGEEPGDEVCTDMEFQGESWTDPRTCAYVDRLCDWGRHRGVRNADCGCGCVDARCAFNDGIPQDAAGQGECSEVLGYAYNGWTCLELRGCECQGTDCEHIYANWNSCLWNYIICLDVICDVMQADGFGNCDSLLGFRYAGVEEGCVAVQGCECQGNQCAYLYASQEECQGTHQSCDTGAPFGCPPWMAAPEGDCEMLLGYTYDGESCVPLTGCSCVGWECEWLDTDIEACLKRTRDCTGHCGSPWGSVSSAYERFDPTTCPDGSAYTIIDSRPQCVDPVSCEETF